jgi:hypothetical protein
MLNGKLIVSGLVCGLLLLGSVARAVEVEELAAPGAQANCCWHPCICYEHRGCPICCCTDAPAIKTSIKVTDPCTCCTVDVPLCLPGCCTGEPCCVKDRCPILFNRELIRYEYCCGVAVTIKISKCGDILVVYHHA